MKKKLTVAGMFLWEVEIEFDDYTRKGQRTLTVATRRSTISEVQRKVAAHLKQYRYDFPKAKIIGITQRGAIDI